MLERTRGGRVDGRTFKEVDIFAVGSESVVPSRAGTNFMRAEREREREREVERHVHAIIMRRRLCSLCNPSSPPAK